MARIMMKRLSSFKSRRQSVVRFFAGFIVLTLTGQEIALAAPLAVPQAVLSLTAAMPRMAFKLPESIATIEDGYAAPNASKTIFLIQDAHTNESGQMNAAKALGRILPGEKISYVFTEGSSHDASLSFLKEFFPQDVLRETSVSFVRKGILKGGEFANLNGEHPFTLWGVEDPDLYDRALEKFVGVMRRRDRAAAYLDRIGRSADVLKEEIYHSALKSLDVNEKAYRDGELSLTEYFDALKSHASKTGIDLMNYSHLSFLNGLKKLESKIDFTRVAEEQESAIRDLSETDRQTLREASRSKHSPFRMGGEDKAADRAFYALLEEKLTAAKTSKSFPELFKYFRYLAESRKMNAHETLNELADFESDVFAALTRSNDERLLHRLSKNLVTLHNLLEMRLSPEDFENYKTQAMAFNVNLIGGFFNKKIQELDRHYDRAVLIEKNYNEVVEAAAEFYELAIKRDDAFLRNMSAKMDQEGISKAVLVTGGYHAPNLKRLFREQGISYVSILPQILHETDSRRYEQIVTKQLAAAHKDKRYAVAAKSRAAADTFMPADLRANQGELIKFITAAGTRLSVSDEERAAITARALAASGLPTPLEQTDPAEAGTRADTADMIQYRVAAGNAVKLTVNETNLYFYFEQMDAKKKVNPRAFNFFKVTPRFGLDSESIWLNKAGEFKDTNGVWDSAILEQTIRRSRPNAIVERPLSAGESWILFDRVAQKEYRINLVSVDQGQVELSLPSDIQLTALNRQESIRVFRRTGARLSVIRPTDKAPAAYYANYEIMTENTTLDQILAAIRRDRPNSPVSSIAAYQSSKEMRQIDLNDLKQVFARNTFITVSFTGPADPRFRGAGARLAAGPQEIFEAHRQPTLAKPARVVLQIGDFRFQDGQPTNTPEWNYDGSQRANDHHRILDVWFRDLVGNPDISLTDIYGVRDAKAFYSAIEGGIHGKFMPDELRLIDADGDRPARLVVNGHEINLHTRPLTNPEQIKGEPAYLVYAADTSVTEEPLQNLVTRWSDLVKSASGISNVLIVSPDEDLEENSVVWSINSQSSVTDSEQVLVMASAPKAAIATVLNALSEDARAHFDNFSQVDIAAPKDGDQGEMNITNKPGLLKGIYRLVPKLEPIHVDGLAAREVEAGVARGATRIKLVLQANLEQADKFRNLQTQKTALQAAKTQLKNEINDGILEASKGAFEPLIRYADNAANLNSLVAMRYREPVTFDSQATTVLDDGSVEIVLHVTDFGQAESLRGILMERALYEIGPINTTRRSVFDRNVRRGVWPPGTIPSNMYKTTPDHLNGDAVGVAIIGPRGRIGKEFMWALYNDPNFVVRAWIGVADLETLGQQYLEDGAQGEGPYIVEKHPAQNGVLRLVDRAASEIQKEKVYVMDPATGNPLNIPHVNIRPSKDESGEAFARRLNSALGSSADSIEMVINASGANLGKDPYYSAFPNLRSVILTAPAKGEVDATVIRGINESTIDVIQLGENGDAHYISCASCTTNGLARGLTELEKFLTDSGNRVRNRRFLTDHSLTPSQGAIGGASSAGKSQRTANDPTQIIALEETGANKAIGTVIPEYKSNFSGISSRNANYGGSVVGVSFTVQRTDNQPYPTKAQINQFFLKRADQPELRGILGYSEHVRSTRQIVGEKTTAVLLGDQTSVEIGNNFATVTVKLAYDNERGYTMAAKHMALLSALSIRGLHEKAQGLAVDFRHGARLAEQDPLKQVRAESLRALEPAEEESVRAFSTKLHQLNGRGAMEYALLFERGLAVVQTFVDSDGRQTVAVGEFTRTYDLKESTAWLDRKLEEGSQAAAQAEDQAVGVTFRQDLADAESVLLNVPAAESHYRVPEAAALFAGELKPAEQAVQAELLVRTVVLAAQLSAKSGKTLKLYFDPADRTANTDASAVLVRAVKDYPQYFSFDAPPADRLVTNWYTADGRNRSGEVNLRLQVLGRGMIARWMKALILPQVAVQGAVPNLTLDMKDLRANFMSAETISQDAYDLITGALDRNANIASRGELIDKIKGQSGYLSHQTLRPMFVRVSEYVQRMRQMISEVASKA